MKTRFLFFLLVFSFLISMSFGQQPAEEKDYSAMLKKYNSKRGERCLQCSNYTPNSYTVLYRNVGAEKIDVKFAVQEANKQWRTFLRPAIAPKDTVAVYACDGTGKSLYWVRKAGDSATEFPSDASINKEYGK